MIAQKILEFTKRPRTEDLRNLSLNLFKSISTFISWDSSAEGFEKNAYENFIEDVSTITQSEISEISEFLSHKKVREIFDIQDVTTTTVKPTTTASTTKIQSTTPLIKTTTSTTTTTRTTITSTDSPTTTTTSTTTTTTSTTTAEKIWNIIPGQMLKVYLY